jgi:hypothetical protein
LRPEPQERGSLRSGPGISSTTPFWRSAKRLELGRIPAEAFAPFIRSRFEDGKRRITGSAVARLLAAWGAAVRDQELAYFLWELVPTQGEATVETVEDALGNVIRSESNHLSQLWDEASSQQRQVMLALADEPTPSIHSAAYRERHELPAPASLQRALGTLIAKEIAGRNAAREYALVEPFLADWAVRSDRDVREVVVEPAARASCRDAARDRFVGPRASPSDETPSHASWLVEPDDVEGATNAWQA